MKAEELRIGNWVVIDDLFPEQITLGVFAVLYKNPHHISLFKGIEISPEILEKAGFELDTDGILHNNYLYYISKNEEEAIFQIALGYSPLANLYHIKYLHQLQNLLHSLTGEELQIDL